MTRRACLALMLLLVWSPGSAAPTAEVRIWEEDLILPTYLLKPPDPNPIFYDRISYQGAQKRVYPYPLQDGITRDRQNRTYRAVYLENRYLRLCILPEIGGRLFSATDKTNGYEFIYRQSVIKPALIGMLGAWISGGIEWCVFHHHRNTTHMPVDYTLTDEPGGGKTLWIGETERRHRMRWVIGLTLRPGTSYFTATVKLINRTALPHAVLYWANVAVHANPDYQVIFPPSVTVATYHAKNAFSRWPVADGSYRGVDYRGVDLSWWKNHPAPVSFFAWDLEEDFMGGYDHGRGAGIVHVGDHHVVCGAKLWEWGPGSIWDTRILTDADGPYAELMVGAFSDNQPDYSWIKPGESKVFTQTWYPVRDIGGFRSANLNGAVNLEKGEDGRVRFGFHTTSPRKAAKAKLTFRERVLFEQTIDIGPDRPFTGEAVVAAGSDSVGLEAVLLTSSGERLIAYRPRECREPERLPEPVGIPAAPAEIPTVDELFLTGLRIEQIHNPALDPLDYYREALRRDPGDSRSNIRIGLDFLKRGSYQAAEKHLREAAARISAGYIRPGDTQADYLLGLALKARDRLKPAEDAFFRASWDQAHRAPAYFQLAAIACRKGRFAQALDRIEKSLESNRLQPRAGALRAMILRKLGRFQQAAAAAEEVLRFDPLDFLAAHELPPALAAVGDGQAAAAAEKALWIRMRGEIQTFLELATDYMDAGRWEEAVRVLRRLLEEAGEEGGGSPLIHYYLGYLHERLGEAGRALEFYDAAAALPVEGCFPFRLETAAVLEAALAARPREARTHLYLGNLLYDLQPEAAIAAWERARALDDSLAVVHRNLGWAYLRIRQDTDGAVTSYRRAIAENADDPRWFLELDDILRRGNASTERRLALFEAHHDTILERKDTLVRGITLLVQDGKWDRAITLLDENRFHVSEGGGGELRAAHVNAHLLRGAAGIRGASPEKALRDSLKAGEFPENLSLERPANDRLAPHVNFRIGEALSALRRNPEARALYQRAAGQELEEDWSEARYYRAMALVRLGRTPEARRIFHELEVEARRRLSEKAPVDYFSKFGDRETLQARRAEALFVLGLGLHGQGRSGEARTAFREALDFDAGHVWARYYLKRLNSTIDREVP